MPNIGVIGLGSMGMGIARSAVAQGLPTWGFDIDDGRVRDFVAAGGQRGSLAETADKLDIAVLVVVNARQAEDILFGDIALASRMPKGALVVACPTMGPADARAIAARVAEAGLLYLDAPISGGAGKAATGALTVMASGSAPAFDAAAPLLDLSRIHI